MTQIQKLPYYTPKPERITVGEWSLVKDDDHIALGKVLPDWDPAMPIHAVVPVQLDLLGILEDCRLSEKAQLRLATFWESSGTMLRGRGEFIDLTQQHHLKQLYLRLSVDGTKLATNIDLITCLVLLQANSELIPFIPKIPGCILAQTAHNVFLEGEGTRFPIEVIDFSQTEYASDASWVLYWDPENLHQTVLGDTRLYLNARHKRVIRAITENLPEDYGIREAVRFDIARMLIMGVLDNEDFVETPNVFMPGSVGWAVHNMLQIYFPNMSLHYLRDNSKTPRLFEPKLQESLRIFWDD